MKKSLWITLGVVLLLLGVFVWYKYYFVFGEGVKSGYLNYAMKKGYVFKTYEGKLIQEGFGSRLLKLSDRLQANCFYVVFTSLCFHKNGCAIVS